MENAFEAHAKVSDFERVSLLDALAEHADSLPVLFGKQSVVVSVQSGAL